MSERHGGVERDAGTPAPLTGLAGLDRRRLGQAAATLVINSATWSPEQPLLAVDQGEGAAMSAEGAAMRAPGKITADG